MRYNDTIVLTVRIVITYVYCNYGRPPCAGKLSIRVTRNPWNRVLLITFPARALLTQKNKVRYLDERRVGDISMEYMH